MHVGDARVEHNGSGVRLLSGEDHNRDGTKAGSAATMGRTRRLAELLARRGLKDGERYAYTEVPGGGHSERSWGARFDLVLRFLFAPR